MTIRNALQKDFDDILRIYARAREYMKHSGNPTQWGCLLYTSDAADEL